MGHFPDRKPFFVERDGRPQPEGQGLTRLRRALVGHWIVATPDYDENLEDYMTNDSIRAVHIWGDHGEMPARIGSRQLQRFPQVPTLADLTNLLQEAEVLRGLSPRRAGVLPVVPPAVAHAAERGPLAASAGTGSCTKTLSRVDREYSMVTVVHPAASDTADPTAGRGLEGKPGEPNPAEMR